MLVSCSRVEAALIDAQEIASLSGNWKVFCHADTLLACVCAVDE
jgi:hypothetical protein